MAMEIYSSKFWTSSKHTFKKYCPLLALLCSCSLNLSEGESVPVDVSVPHLGLQDEVHEAQHGLVQSNPVLVAGL